MARSVTNVRSEARRARRWSSGLAATGLVVGVVLAAASSPIASASPQSMPAPGTVFVTTTSSSRNVVEIPPGGKATVLKGTNLTRADSIAVDGAGDLYVAAEHRVVELPADGGPESTVGTDISSPSVVALDADGDVFILEASGNGDEEIVEVPADGEPQETVVGSLFYLDTMTVDRSGNVYVSEYQSAGRSVIEELPGDGATAITIGTVPFYATRMTADSSGDLYLVGGDGITELPAGGGPQRTFGSGLPDTVSVAVDSDDDIYTNTFFTVDRIANCRTTTLAKGLNVSGLAVYEPGSADQPAPRFASITPAPAAVDRPAPASPVATAGHTASDPPAAPYIRSVYPPAGPVAGGQAIEIVGNFYSPADGTVSVSVGQPDGAPPIPATNVSYGHGVIEATTGGGAKPGTYSHVIVTDAGGTSVATHADLYQYLPPPTITAITPDSGTTHGCQELEITGTGFTTDSASGPPYMTVEIGQGRGAGPSARTAIDVDVLSPTELTATTRAGLRGTWYVFVSGEAGTSVARHRHDVYTYTAP